MGDVSRDVPSGTAYREMYSLLEAKDEDVLAVTSGAIGAGSNVTAGHIGTSGGISVFQEPFDVDIKSVLAGQDKVVSSIGVPLKPEQPGAALLHSFMDETEQAPFPATEGTRRRSDPNSNDLTLRRQLAGEIGDSAMHSRGQSVVEAVTAAASGKGGWDTRESASARHMGNGDVGDGDVDVSLHLFPRIDGDLSIQPDGENGPHADVSRQGVPQGLSDFAPQGDVDDRDGANDARNRRLQQVVRQRDLTGMKDLDNLQRFVSGKGKPESCSSGVRQNGRTVTARNDANCGGTGVRKNGSNMVDSGKVGKEGSRSGGSRRGAQRKMSGGGDGREKRQKTSASSADAR